MPSFGPNPRTPCVHPLTCSNSSDNLKPDTRQQAPTLVLRISCPSRREGRAGERAGACLEKYVSARSVTGVKPPTPWPGPGRVVSFLPPPLGRMSFYNQRGPRGLGPRERASLPLLHQTPPFPVAGDSQVTYKPRSRGRPSLSGIEYPFQLPEIIKGTEGYNEGIPPLLPMHPHPSWIFVFSATV